MKNYSRLLPIVLPLDLHVLSSSIGIHQVGGAKVESLENGTCD